MIDEIPPEEWNVGDIAQIRSHIDLEEWFKENYFLFNFDAVLPFWPGDYLAIRDDRPVIVELECDSATTWIHKEHIRKFFNFILCYHVADIDYDRFKRFNLECFSIEEYMKEDLEKLRTRRLAKVMGIKKLPE